MCAVALTDPVLPAVELGGKEAFFRMYVYYSSFFVQARLEAQREYKGVAELKLVNAGILVAIVHDIHSCYVVSENTTAARRLL